MTAPHHCYRAFTVIEILAVIVLIALAGVLVAFQIYPRMESTALRAAGSQLLLACRYARLTAAQNQQLCELQLDHDQNDIRLMIRRSGIVVTADAKPSDIASLVPSHDYHPFTLSNPVRFGRILIDGEPAPATGKTAICFYPDGTAQSAEIRIETPDDALAVTVDRQNAKARLCTVVSSPDTEGDLSIESSTHYE